MDNFYAITAGASATLLGLLFLAVQLHMNELSADPLSRWQALARTTFGHFILLFILSLLMLLPIASTSAAGLVILIVVAGGIQRLLWTWLPIWRRTFQDRRERIAELLWQLASPLAAYLALGAFAIDIWRAGINPRLQDNIGFCVIGLLTITLRNSWKLLIEVSLEEARSSRE